MYVACQHVRHKKIGIAHRGNNQVEALTGLPHRVKSHFFAGGRGRCLGEVINTYCSLCLTLSELSGT